MRFSKGSKEGHQPPAAFCLAVKASLCSSAGIADSPEPNGDGGTGTGTCSDPLGHGAESGKGDYCEPML